MVDILLRELISINFKLGCNIVILCIRWVLFHKLSLFQKFFFQGINEAFCAVGNKVRSVGDTGNDAVPSMRRRIVNKLAVNSASIIVWIENVKLVVSLWHPIVQDELGHHLLGCLAHKCNTLAVAPIGPPHFLNSVLEAVHWLFNMSSYLLDLIIITGMILF